MYQDLVDFHLKFGLIGPPVPQLLDQETFLFRVKFLHEELTEFKKAHRRGDLVEAADGLIDLVYVAMGTAYLMGLPWDRLWAEVQRSNMAKERAVKVEQSKRGSTLDVVKPVGWIPPRLEQILLEAAGQQRLFP